MNRKTLGLVLAIAVLLSVASVSFSQDFLQPYTPDEYTVLLLHFDGSLEDESGLTGGGIGHGNYQFVPGLPNFGQCLYLKNDAIDDKSFVTVLDTSALDITTSFTLEAWVYFLTFGEGWSDWRGAPRILAKGYAYNNSYPGSWWFPNYWLMGDSYGGIYVFGGGFMGIDPDDSTWVVNGDLRQDESFIQLNKWYHITFIHDMDSYPRREMLLIHDENGELLSMLNRAIEDTSYVIATSDTCLFIGYGGGGDDSWLDGFVDEIRISNTVRQFSIPPVIYDVTQVENTTDTEGPYTVSAIVTDYDGLASVKLKYDVGDGWVEAPMTDMGDDVYEGEIPGQPTGTLIKYYVEAVDVNSDTSTSPEDAPESYYSFVIITEKTMVLHLTFEEGSGDPVDHSSVGHTSIIHGGVTYSTDAKVGNYAAYFNSAEQGYIEVDPTAFLDLSEFTVEMWIKPDTFQNNVRILSKVGADNYAWYQPNYELKETAAGFLEVGSYCEPGGWNNFTSDSVMYVGNWYHIAYVFRDSVAILNILNENDQVVQIRTVSQVGTPISTTGSLMIGHAGGDAEPYYSGLIDEIKIYNYAKTFEFQWQPMVPDENTVLLLHFDGDLSDASGNVNDGSVSDDNKVSYVASLPDMGQALYLNNSTEGGAYVTIPDADVLDLSGKFSVEASFKLLSKGESWQTDPRIWAKPGSEYWWRTNYYAMIRNDNAFAAGYYSANGYHDNAGGADLFKLNTWYHMKFYYDEDAGYTQVTVIDSFGAVIFEQNTPIGDNPLDYPTDLPLVIGFGGGGSDSYFDGYIDELRIQNYNRTVGIETAVTTPETFQLHQNYPNPFNPSTTIVYEVPEQSLVSVKIYNLLGQNVSTLVNEYKSPGKYSVVWNGTDNNGLKLNSGLYIVKLEAGNTILSRKILLLK